MKKIALVLVLAVAPASAFAFTFTNEVPKPIQQQMNDDINFIGSIQGGTASALHQQIFGMVDGTTYRNFFDSRVLEVGMSTCGGDSKAVACVIPNWFGKTTQIFLTQNYIKFSHPQVARMMVVFHESRHTEDSNHNWPHASCPTPFIGQDGNEIKSIWTGSSLAGEPACDITPFGSYGSSMIMLKNIQKFCTSCTDKVKMDAGIYADDQYKRITDTHAVKQIADDLYRE